MSDVETAARTLAAIDQLEQSGRDVVEMYAKRPALNAMQTDILNKTQAFLKTLPPLREIWERKLSDARGEQ